VREEALHGGLVDAGFDTGQVKRRTAQSGDVVVRPAPPAAAALHRHLQALVDAGFDGAPRPVRLAGDQETLTFVAGEVAVEPFPGWSRADAALRSVGALLRRLHDAPVGVPADAAWPTEFADPEGGPVLCHNDPAQENVVFRDGEAVALIDFDFAAPGRPVWDLALAAWYWVPMTEAEDGVAAARRLRILADGYGLSDPDRRVLPRLIAQATTKQHEFVDSRVAAGDPVFTRLDADLDPERWAKTRAWQEQHRVTFLDALLI
jgi:aminoglycoside phosphotransferase (APT) family kinase protein